ncbi:MAG TPA: Gmad2 immunoglobulin-like domain-containing protein [Acidimicrobiales bacterium]|nr:Gmad2 immunoglobulin-like domain-containing protein [Acidimicrobiales bacterium]
MSVLHKVDARGPSSPETLPPDLPPPGRPPGKARLWLALALVGVMALVGVIVLTPRSLDDGTSPSTTAGPSATTVPATTEPAVTTTPGPGAVDTTTAVFPGASSGVRFDEPVPAARAFAVDFVGFVDPVVGPFRQGDSQSGEVDVRPAPDGPVTTVLVRRLGDSWWVLGSATANIDLRRPGALDSISSPVRLQGVSTAFEANVSVEIRQDGARRPIGSSWVMGGSMGEMGPFDGTVEFSEPTSALGAVVLFTESMENGNLWEASVVRVRFAGAATLTPASACPGYSMERPEATSTRRVVTVFYACDVDAAPVPTYRLVPAAPGVLRLALESLLAGPTAAEAEAGLQSWFGPATAGMLADVVIQDGGRAVVDFHDLRPVIPNASTSAGSRMLLDQLDATVFQFSSVRSVTYRIEGDCEAFTEWLQFGGCEARTR